MNAGASMHDQTIGQLTRLFLISGRLALNVSHCAARNQCESTRQHDHASLHQDRQSAPRARRRDDDDDVGRHGGDERQAAALQSESIRGQVMTAPVPGFPPALGSPISRPSVGGLVSKGRGVASQRWLQAQPARTALQGCSSLKTPFPSVCLCLCLCLLDCPHSWADRTHISAATRL
jgi:hypothetical protein